MHRFRLYAFQQNSNSKHGQKRSTMNLPTAWLLLTIFAPPALETRSAIPRPNWKVLSIIHAPEAFQAVASDNEHYYFIGSRSIVQYSRKTKQRIATSTGSAQHLNSGFFWKKQLLCAHSNYPQVPERSEIKILSPKTMTLSTYKTFGDYGGSLTWAVFHKDSWWCNFARYGEENGQTFLVQFDRDWRELQRWHYPEDVIRELGSYSLSGGLWYNQHLLVTGHDKPVLYVLEVCQQQHPQQLVAKHDIPFSGQGIAIDVLTQGLLGIQRDKQQVILATLCCKIVSRKQGPRYPLP